MKKNSVIAGAAVVGFLGLFASPANAVTSKPNPPTNCVSGYASMTVRELSPTKAKVQLHDNGCGGQSVYFSGYVSDSLGNKFPQSLVTKDVKTFSHGVTNLTLYISGCFDQYDVSTLPGPTRLNDTIFPGYLKGNYAPNKNCHVEQSPTPTPSDTPSNTPTPVPSDTPSDTPTPIIVTESPAPTPTDTPVVPSSSPTATVVVPVASETPTVPTTPTPTNSTVVVVPSSKPTSSEGPGADDSTPTAKPVTHVKTHVKTVTHSTVRPVVRVHAAAHTTAPTQVVPQPVNNATSLAHTGAGNTKTIFIVGLLLVLAGSVAYVGKYLLGRG